MTVLRRKVAKKKSVSSPRERRIPASALFTSPISRRERTELERLAAMPDSAIDYSDAPAVNPTSSEMRAIRRGEAAYRRGDYITLDEYFRELDRHPRRARKNGA